MPEEVVIKLESEDSVDDDSAQIEGLMVLSEKVGILEAKVATLETALEAAIKIEANLAQEISSQDEEIVEIKEEISQVLELGQQMEEQLQEATEEITEDTEAIQEELPSIQEEIAQEAKTPAKAPEPEPEPDHAPGKEHWFFRKRGR